MPRKAAAYDLSSINRSRRRGCLYKHRRGGRIARYRSTKKNSSRLTAQLEAVLGAIEVLALEAAIDVAYGVIRASLARTGKPIGANDLLIAAHALSLGLTVVPTTSVSSYELMIFGSKTGYGEVDLAASSATRSTSRRSDPSLRQWIYPWIEQGHARLLKIAVVAGYNCQPVMECRRRDDGIRL
jgi:hypothetical protein